MRFMYGRNCSGQREDKAGSCSGLKVACDGEGGGLLDDGGPSSAFEGPAASAPGLRPQPSQTKVTAAASPPTPPAPGARERLRLCGRKTGPGLGERSPAGGRPAGSVGHGGVGQQRQGGSSVGGRGELGRRRFQSTSVKFYLDSGLSLPGGFTASLLRPSHSSVKMPNGRVAFESESPGPRLVQASASPGGGLVSGQPRSAPSSAEVGDVASLERVFGGETGQERAQKPREYQPNKVQPHPGYEQKQ
ncbi:hypothetical protein MJG53_009188 [Ovis ammon polii x Ovis aries]|uniref:Uncharacterized protein n=1 Tax=Ovis ammon polii x Ovis aries TaxID=2918886 RepID=A0ACB9UYV6_9CETA|nr:hypothetical protein MJG53_009188 [Ovis ammon polii x Ovis aries]